MDSANDMKAHARSYERFIGMLKWTIPFIAIVTALIVILISS